MPSRAIEQEHQDFGAESKYWCWTLFKTDEGYEREYPDKLEEFKTERATATVTYSRAQEERCSTSGRFHLQGYVEFEKRIKFTTLKNTFNRRIHWSKRRGTAAQADEYCNKDDTRVAGGLSWVIGTISHITGPGQRTDLDNVKSMILSGAKRKAIVEEHFGAYVKYHKGLEAAAVALDINIDDEPPMFRDMECHIMFGESGAGKSLACLAKMDGDTYYEPERNAQGLYSFETYKKQKWIFLDEFTPKALPNMEVLKKIMDRPRCRLPGRGSNSSKWGWHTGVLISTNHDPQTWTEGHMQDTDWKAISRRCHYVFHCLKTHWTVIGGTKEDVGTKMESPLPSLLEWAATKQQDGVSQ